jgi:hypothetical protein
MTNLAEFKRIPSTDNMVRNNSSDKLRNALGSAENLKAEPEEFAAPGPTSNAKKIAQSYEDKTVDSSSCPSSTKLAKSTVPLCLTKSSNSLREKVESYAAPAVVAPTNHLLKVVKANLDEAGRVGSS